MIRCATAVILYVVAATPGLAQSQHTSGAATVQGSLGDSLRHSLGKEIHILYIHGIGSDGPDDRDSSALRKSICDYLKDCTTPDGSVIGQWDYADQGEFRPDAPPPELEYLDAPVWKNKEEWMAAAPYAVHFQLARSNGQTLYVDELNWWPLTFSLKCRQIIASDAEFVAPNKARIKVCSRREPNPGVAGRFKSYDWIPGPDAQRLLQLPNRGAKANRILKTSLMDWGFSDAVMALGPLRPYVLDGLRQLILKSLADSPDSANASPSGSRANKEFVVVSHSLGSYLIFSALDMDQTTAANATPELKANFREILERTSLVYFFANQLRLLELVGLDGPGEKNMATHLEDWARARCEYLKTLPGARGECQPPQIVAVNDPSDLLTWTVPELPGVRTKNYSVKNATRWFGLIENPGAAHSNYASDKRAIKDILNASPAEK